MSLPPTGLPLSSQAAEHSLDVLETMISSASKSSSKVNGVSSTGIKSFLHSWMRCILVMPGRMKWSVGWVLNTPSFKMETLLWAHSVTMSPLWNTTSSQPAATAFWDAMTLGRRLRVLMLQWKKRVSSTVMSFKELSGSFQEPGFMVIQRLAVTPASGNSCFLMAVPRLICQ